MITFTATYATASSHIDDGGQTRQLSVRPAFRIPTGPLIHGRAVPQQPGPDAGKWPQAYGLNFLNGEALLLSFVGRSDIPVLAPRASKSAGEEYVINGIELSAESGKVMRNATWPVVSRWSRIASASDFGLVILTGNRLELISPDLSVRKTLLLPPPPPPSWAPGIEAKYLAYASPDGTRLVLTGDLEKSVPWRWIDTASLNPLAKFQGLPDWSSVCVSNQRVWAAPFRTRQILWTRTPSSAWAPLPLPQYAGDEMACQSSVGPGMVYGYALKRDFPHEPIDAGSFIAFDNGNRSWPVTTDPSEGSPGRAAVARNGKRFVILVEKTVGRHDWIDMPGHTVLRGLLIYDAPFSPEPLQLTVRDSKVASIYGAVLSPDGRQLAVIGENGLIEVFNLPPPAADAQ